MPERRPAEIPSAADRFHPPRESIASAEPIEEWTVVGIEYFEDEAPLLPPAPPLALSALLEAQPGEQTTEASRTSLDHVSKDGPARARSSRQPATTPSASDRTPTVGPVDRRLDPGEPRRRRVPAGRLLVAAVAMACVVLAIAVLVKTRNDAAVAARDAAAYTSSATPGLAALGPAIAVVGDSGVTQSAPGVPQEARWTGLVQANLSGAVTTLASTGSGYTTSPADGRTFVEQAASVPANAEVVLFFGGAADRRAGSLAVARAATTAISAVDARAPDVDVIVIGPVIAAGATPKELAEVRNGLRTAAGIAKVTYVDPIDSDWLPARMQGASSPTALTASDEKAVATEVEALVERALR